MALAGSRHALQGALGRQQLLGELLLLLAGNVARHAAVHRLVGPLVALTADGCHALGQATAFGLALRLEAAESREELPAQLGDELGGEGLLVPLALHGGFKLVDRYVGQVAARAPGVSAGADEVLVLIAAAAAGNVVEQPGVAAAAVEAAAQVVLMAVGALACLAVSGQHALDLLEGLRRDEDRVLALVLDAAPGDEADVVAVPQHLVQLVGWQRPRCPLRRRSLLQAALLKQGRQLPQAVVTGGVGLEGPLEVIGPLRVDDDGAGLGAVHELPRVQVAQGSDVRGTSGGHLLLRTFDDLVGEVARVELSDRTHDAVHEGTARRLVDVLGDADQLGAGGLDLCRDVDVVEAVPGQAVDLVHDDVAHVGREQVGEHALQLRPVSGAGRFAALDENLGNGGVKAGCVPQAGLTLRRDRVAVRVALAL